MELGASNKESAFPSFERILFGAAYIIHEGMIRGVTTRSSGSRII